MADAIEAAGRFAGGRQRADLDTDEMLLFALVRAVEVVGEAASRVTEATRAEVPLPWAAVVGMRNRLVHAYFEVDRDILWATVQRSLPDLHMIVHAALSKPDAALSESGDPQPP